VNKRKKHALIKKKEGITAPLATVGRVNKIYLLLLLASSFEQSMRWFYLHTWTKDTNHLDKISLNSENWLYIQKYEWRWRL